MKNYYRRDKRGDWFVRDGRKWYPMEVPVKMNIAYCMGALDTIKDLREMDKGEDARNKILADYEYQIQNIK